MRSPLSGCCVLTAALVLFACGAPTAADAPSAPVMTASVAPATPAAPATAAAPPPHAALAAAADPCGGTCPGHVGPALVEAIATRAKQAHRCYDNALAADRTLRGRVTVRMTIGSDGRVCDVRADSDKPPMEAVAGCVAGFYRKNTGDERFPAPEGGCAIVNAPLVFVPRADDAGAPGP